jgi:hypothetical protein
MESSYVGIAFYAIYTIFWLLGLFKLLANWSAFGDRSIGMLLVLIFLPFGFIWPLVATPERTSRKVRAARPG